MPSSTAKEPIIVIGAGVTGLSVATLLQKQYPASPVIIVATESPLTSSPSVDYASMWAGAHYRPYPRSTSQLEDEGKMGERTMEIMKQIARETPEAGVELVYGVEHFENPSEDILTLKTGIVHAGADDGFRILDKTELPEGVKFGCGYQSYCINIKIYSRWLLAQFLSRGGRLIEYRLSNAAEAFDFALQRGLGRASIVVNCSGRNFDLDPKMKIIRGQTVLVRQQYHETVTRQNADGTWTFLIPRPLGGGTIVGGTKEIDDWETKPRTETRLRLLQASVAAYPDFIDSVEKFEVLQDNVGRRPWRDGGYRFEVESVSPQRTIVHGYGAGGRGYELSWAAAENILELIKDLRSLKARARL